MQPPTALLTGASDGIGLDFGRILAQRGYDLVLVARREEKLKEVAASLISAHGIRAHVLPCDLAQPGAAADLHRRVGELGVCVDFLVNNAGLLFNGYFGEISRESQEDLLAVNVVALTSLTHLFLKDMLARRRGHILNVASTAAWVAIPQQNVYAASKAYVLSFTLALHEEVKARQGNIHVTALCPGYTRTRMLDNPDQGRKLAIPEAAILEPEMVAREGVEGCIAGHALVVPGISNRIGMSLVQMLPRTWVTSVAGALYRRGMS